MKFDKLEKWYAGQCSPSCVVYGANEVDAAIAELKAENKMDLPILSPKFKKHRVLIPIRAFLSWFGYEGQN